MSGHLISTDLVPVGGFYLFVMAVLAAGLRLHRRDSDPDRARHGGRRPGWLARRFPPGWRAFALQVTVTALGGYLLLMAVLTGYYYGVSKVRGNFLVSACTGCAMLVGLALTVFAAASWLAWRRADRPARPAAPPPARPPAAGPEPGPGLIRE